MLVGVQLLALGLYLPPVFKGPGPDKAMPPQMIISLPVHTAVWDARSAGALLVLVAIQLLVVGLYLPPDLSLVAPQMIISVPVQTAVCSDRAAGALVVFVAVQVSVTGWYLPPVFTLLLPL